MPKKILAIDQVETPEPIYSVRPGTAIFNSTAQSTLQIPQRFRPDDRKRMDNR